MRHPMDINTNTRVRWELLKQSPFMKDLRGKRVLDLGAGLGFFSMQMQRLGAEVTAADVDENALDYIRENLGIQVLRLDVLVDPLPEGPFDFIFIGEILEHVPTPDVLVKKAVDALGTGGILLLTTPAMEGPLIHTKGKQLGHDHGAEKHERDGFFAEELEGLASDAGLTVVEQRQCIFYLSELFMQLTKYAYLRKRPDYHGQSDILAAMDRFGYRALRVVFPALLALFMAEEKLLDSFKARGHCHMLMAKKEGGKRV